MGGGTILGYYGNSLWACLNALYPEIEWKIEWFRLFESGYWKHKSNQKKFFEDLAKTIGVQKPSDWGKLTWNTLISYPGGNSLIHYYGNTLSALKSVFPGRK